MSDTAIIEALTAARLSGEKLMNYPGPTPAGMAGAFAIQCAVRDGLGWRHAGWKIGCTSEKARAPTSQVPMTFSLLATNS